MDLPSEGLLEPDDVLDLADIVYQLDGCLTSPHYVLREIQLQGVLEMRDKLLLEDLGSHLLATDHSLPLLVEVGRLVVQGLLPSQHVDPLGGGFR